MNNKQRLFFALLPNESIKSKIIEFRNQLNSNNISYKNNIKIIPDDNLHLTLLFLGKVEQDLIINIIQAAQNIKFKKFIINLDILGYFTRSDILYLGCTQNSDDLLNLRNNIISNLQSVLADNIYLNNNKANNFKLHVSLLKKVSDLDYKNNLVNINNKYNLKINWPIDEFYLMQSEITNKNNITTVEYKPVAYFKSYS